MANISPGQIVALKDGQRATVRYAGTTHFAEGVWIGVELEGPTGKNDGSVAGERYFDCTPLHGMFLRPVGISKILEHKAASSRGRPQSGNVSGAAALKRSSTLGSQRNSSHSASSPSNSKV